MNKKLKEHVIHKNIQKRF